MRSELVFGAIPEIPNRYQLCQLVAKATRKLHKPNTRLQDTVNAALSHLGSSDAVVGQDKSDGAIETAESRRAA